jgi:deaminated glutathione amidase
VPDRGLPCGMRVAAVQTTATADRDKNLEAAVALVEEAADAGATLVVLPELFSVAGSPDHLRRHAEGVDGPTVCWASALAARRRIHLLAGSFPERAGDGRHVFNTSCLVGPDGSFVAAYRKVHLFDVRLGDTDVRESATFVAGNELCVTPIGSPVDERSVSHEGSGLAPLHEPILGLSICYDLRFPELFRILTLRGATVVAVPAAFTAATGPAHWELLLRARAIENQVYVIAAGQVGRLPAGMPACHGHSMIVDPWGTVMAERHHPDPGVVIADLDFDALARVRAELPVLAHRRPDAYVWADDQGNRRASGDSGGRLRAVRNRGRTNGRSRRVAE